MVRHLTLPLIALAVIALFGRGAADTAVAAQPGRAAWTQLMPTAAPSARSFAAMAPNPGGGVVLLGGIPDSGLGSEALGDTWIFAGGRWSEQQPTSSPPPRFAGMMAYDEARGVVVLFGGRNSTEELSDTWTWDGASWTLHNPATSPPPRDGAAMAYDVARRMTLLFETAASLTGVSATWAWDGVAWTRLNEETSSPLLGGAYMAYDGANKVVLLGGCFFVGRQCAPADHTWTWDGRTWIEQPPATVPPVWPDFHSYHPGLGTVILLGADGRNFDWQIQTWARTGTAWTQLDLAASPSPRLGPAIAYDPDSDAIILFGGEDMTQMEPGRRLSDTWALSRAR